MRSFPKIDAHVHYNCEDNGLLKLAKKYGYSLLSINTEVPEFPSLEKQKNIAQKHRRSSKRDFFYATTVSTKNIFNEEWAKKTIEKIKQDHSAGAVGVKFWKNIGMSIQCDDGSFLMLDSEKFKPVFHYLEDNDITVLGHQGEPKNCWLPINEMTVKSDRDYFTEHPQYHMYLHDEYPGYWEHIEARDQILEIHNNLKFVGLHLASLEWNLDEVTKRLVKYSNLAVDLAERFSHLYYHAARNRKEVIDFFHRFQDRIIYGTDIIYNPDDKPESIFKNLKSRWETHWLFLSSKQKMTSPEIDKSFKGLDLPSSILEKIYRINALNWYQIESF